MPKTTQKRNRRPPGTKPGRPKGSLKPGRVPVATMKRFKDIIQTRLLIERVQNHALATETVQKVKRGRRTVEISKLSPRNNMCGTQLKAAEILLDRVTPRLNRTTTAGDPDEPQHVVQQLSLTPELLELLKHELAKDL